MLHEISVYIATLKALKLFFVIHACDQTSLLLKVISLLYMHMNKLEGIWNVLQCECETEKGKNGDYSF